MNDFHAPETGALSKLARYRELQQELGIEITPFQKYWQEVRLVANALDPAGASKDEEAYRIDKNHKGQFVERSLAECWLVSHQHARTFKSTPWLAAQRLVAGTHAEASAAHIARWNSEQAQAKLDIQAQLDSLKPAPAVTNVVIDRAAILALIKEEKAKQ